MGGERQVTMSERALDGVLVAVHPSAGKHWSEYRHDKCKEFSRDGENVMVVDTEPKAATAPKCGKCGEPLTFLGK